MDDATQSHSAAAPPRSHGQGQARRGGWHGGPQKRHKGESTGPAPLPANASPAEVAFHRYAIELTAKHDRYEALVKQSRDVTIHSKRVIFVLHRLNPGNRDEVLAEAQEKLAEIRRLLADIAGDLAGHDRFQYARAFSPGVQEYVEAATFYIYNAENRVATLEDINAQLQTASEGPAFVVDPIDYMLGIADLTGELMRMAITNLADPEEKISFQILNVLRTIHDGFRALSPSAISRDMTSKLTVMANSVAKVEDSCYALKVRGTEIPKDKLLQVLATEADAEPRMDSAAD